MIYAGILAGGIGSRMGIQDMPKQFLMLGNKPIIIHTIEKFLVVPDIDQVYVAVHPNWLVYFNDLVNKHLPGHESKIKAVDGGGIGMIVSLISSQILRRPVLFPTKPF